MESYRIYKSLPLEDFEDCFAFVMAKVGLDITPIIQDTNWLKKEKPQSEDYWKEYLVTEIGKAILFCGAKLERNVFLSEEERYYFVVPEPLTDKKEETKNEDCNPEIPVHT